MESIEIELTHKMAWLLQQGRLRLIDCPCDCQFGELINDNEIECLDCSEINPPINVPYGERTIPISQDESIDGPDEDDDSNSDGCGYRSSGDLDDFDTPRGNEYYDDNDVHHPG